MEDEKLRREQEKEDKRVHVKQNNEKIMSERVNNYMNKLEQTDYKVARAKARLEQDVLVKNNMDFMKELDRNENVRRIQDMQEYRRVKLLEKIEKDNERTRQIRQEQDNLLNMRLKIRQEMEQHKEQLMSNFADKKQRKKLQTALSTGGFGNGGLTRKTYTPIPSS